MFERGSKMIYSHEVEEMCTVAKGVNHGPAPIPEEGKWVKAKEIKELSRKDHPRHLGGLEILKYIGPGLLVTVGFIDPGNWATNLAAGSDYGYLLLWVITLSIYSYF